MHFKFLFHHGLILAVLGLCACSHSGDSGAHAPGLSGPLVDVVKSIQGPSDSLFLDPCDDTYRDLKMKVAAILDARASEITQFEANAPLNSKKYKEIDVGPTKFYEPVEFVPGEDRIDIQTQSWARVQEMLAKIQGQASWDLVELNSDVRSLLIEDKQRILYHENSDIEQSDEPQIRELYDATLACLDKPSCQQIEVDYSTQLLFDKTPIYRLYHELSFYGRRNEGDLKDFRDRLSWDLWRFGFNKNSGVQQIAPGVLEVNLNSGEFKVGESYLAAMTNSVWSQDPRLKINIRWTENSADHAFRILFEPILGGRSYVWDEKQEMHLYPSMNSRVFTHELGHVIGFQDHYDMVFRRDVCGYDYKANLSDIMASSRLGSATQNEISEILKNYTITSSPSNP